MSKIKEGLITVLRPSDKPLDGETLKGELSRLAKQSINSYFDNLGWAFTNVNVTNDGNTYEGKLLFIKSQARNFQDEVFQKQFEQLQDRFYNVVKPFGWRSEGDDDDEIAQSELISGLSLPESIDQYFGHLYNLDAQIRIIQSSIKGAMRSGFYKRNHCLLYGQPACGKTETLLAFEKIIGPDKVIKLDATATTKAGAENLILELKPIPPIIIIEEMEKCNPVNLPWLLGILDKRGEIIKTTGKKGYMRKEARCLCLGTVNNIDEFRNIMSGALASRFQHQIYFPRPGRKILRKILEREVKEIQNGNPAWVKPALDHCINAEKCNDPRRAIALLDGGDDLLTGEYQKDLIKIQMIRSGDDQGITLNDDDGLD